MKASVRSLALVAPLLALTALSPTPATGQVALTLAGGPAEYDLAGTGWSGTAGAHVEVGLTSWLRAEGGTGVFWYKSQGSTERISMLLPEVGVTAQASGAIPIYLGVGVGHTLGVQGDPENDPTLYGALGLSIPIAAQWLVRPEMKVRSVDPWVGVIAGFTLGVTLRLDA